MYLIIFRDGRVVTVNDNLSVSDVLAVSQGLIEIIRFKFDRYERLIKDERGLYWIPVKECKTVITNEGIAHL